MKKIYLQPDMQVIHIETIGMLAMSKFDDETKGASSALGRRFDNFDEEDEDEEY